MKRKTNRSPIDIFRGQSGGGNYGLSALLACLLLLTFQSVHPGLQVHLQHSVISQTVGKVEKNLFSTQMPNPITDD